MPRSTLDLPKFYPVGIWIRKTAFPKPTCFYLLIFIFIFGACSVKSNAYPNQIMRSMKSGAVPIMTVIRGTAFLVTY